MRIITDFSVTSAPLRARRGWHPGWLFRGGALGGWYDPSDLSTLFEDAAASVPVTGPDQPVGHMRDKSGNGFHLSQPNAAARPIYRSAGGLHWLQFDGVDDRMYFSSPLDLSHGTATIGFVEPEGTSAHSILLSPSNAGYLSLRGPVSGQSQRSLSKNNGGSHAIVDTPDVFPATAQSAFSVRIDGGDIFARRLGEVEYTNSESGRADFALTTLMAFNTQGQLAAAGDFFGAVLHVSHLPSQDVERSLKFISERMIA